MIFLIEGKAFRAKKKKKVDFSNNLTINPGVQGVDLASLLCSRILWMRPPSKEWKRRMGAQRKSAIPRNTEACRTSQTLLYHKGGSLYGGWEACGGGLERKEGCQGVLIQVP